MWDLPGPGFEPVSPALAGGFLTTVPPGKSLFVYFNVEECVLSSVYVNPACLCSAVCMLRGVYMGEPRCTFQACARTPCPEHDGDVRVSDNNLCTPGVLRNVRGKTPMQPSHT